MKFRAKLAAKYLNEGGVISHPTDTIQGLACLPDFESSVGKVIELKRRSKSKGLILLSSDVRYFESYVSDSSQLKLIKNTNTPTTYLLKAKQGVSDLLTGGYDTIAVRLTSNDLVVQLCNATKSALVSTSANMTGKKTAISTLELVVFFKQELDFVIAPKSYNSSPSRIINLDTGERLR